MEHIGCGHIGNGVTGTVAVRLRLKLEQLLYDIRNYAYIEGHVSGEGIDPCAKHTLIDIGEDGNLDRVTRILSVAYSGVKELLYPFTKQESEAGYELSDELEEPEEYVIEMNVPATMSKTTVELLEKLIHEYMVYRALYDWLSITKPEAAANWLAKSQAASEEIKVIKNMRTGVLRRKGQWF